jgi:MFS family permease
VYSLSLITLIAAAAAFLPDLRKNAQSRRDFRKMTFGAGCGVVFVSIVTARILLLLIQRVVDADGYRSHRESNWRIGEAVEICGLAAALGLFAGTWLEAALGAGRRRIGIGMLAGLVAGAGQMVGNLIAGLASEYWFVNGIHQQLVFPVILAVFALALAFKWNRVPDRRRGIVVWGGLLACGVLAWISVRWFVPDHLF